MKQYSEACDQNRDPILAILRETFAGARDILEIGSGTGQHAVYFGARLPALRWQTSDLPASHPSINAWLQEAGLANVLPPLVLDVAGDDWPGRRYDGIFSANTTHIMNRHCVTRLFRGVGATLAENGCFCLYGPFNYNHRYTSASNARFDAWLKSRDPASGIRNFEDLDALATDNGMTLAADHAMPANNRLLVWRRT